MRALLKLGADTLGLGTSRQYTAESVKYWMRAEPDCTQAMYVRRQLESVGSFVHEPKLRARYRGLESYHKRLPLIVSMYVRGSSIEEIADYYKPVFTDYGVTRSLDILSGHIADRLNKGQ